MKATVLRCALVMAGIVAGCSSSTTSNGKLCFGAFQQYWKCPANETSLGNKGSEPACLAACEAEPNAVGCWYLDGTGGFPQDCRICLGTPPLKETFSNDFAAPLAPCPATTGI